MQRLAELFFDRNEARLREALGGPSSIDASAPLHSAQAALALLAQLYRFTNSAVFYSGIFLSPFCLFGCTDLRGVALMERYDRVVSTVQVLDPTAWFPNRDRSMEAVQM
jgi:hypothetical protein